MERIYLDHAATTPLDPAVFDAMRPYLEQSCGNASSLHREGTAARDGVEDAREEIAALLGARPEEIHFTSGGTESNNAAIFGVAWARADHGKQLITSQIEHHAVLHPCEELARQGWTLEILPVTAEGRVREEDLRDRLTDTTALVSIMLANNEVGTIQDIAALGALAHDRGATMHCDAVQAVGRLPLELSSLPVDLLSISAHKLHGPQGVGALFVREGTPLRPLAWGGSHEFGRRAGTENVAGIVGLRHALRLCIERREADACRLAALRDRLRDGIRARIPEVHFNSPETGVLPHLLNVSFEHVEGEAILLTLNIHGVATATGSACTSESLAPSHVLRAMGVPDERAQCSIRFSLGRDNTEQEIDRTLEALVVTVDRLRQLSPLYEESS